METTRGPIERDGGHHPRHGSTSQLRPSKACRQFRGAIRTRSGRRGHPPRRHLQASAIWEASCHGIRAARERSTGDRGSDFGAADSQRRAEQGVEKPTRGRGPGGGIVAVTVFSSAARIRLRVASYCRRGLRARMSWRPLANSIQTDLGLGLGCRHRPLFTFWSVTWSALGAPAPSPNFDRNICVCPGHLSSMRRVVVRSVRGDVILQGS